MQIPIWWRWLIWVAPFHYAFTGLFNNEFAGPSYEGPGKMSESVAPDGVGQLLYDLFDMQQGHFWRCEGLPAHD